MLTPSPSSAHLLHSRQFGGGIQKESFSLSAYSLLQQPPLGSPFQTDLTLLCPECIRKGQVYVDSLTLDAPFLWPWVQDTKTQLLCCPQRKAWKGVRPSTHSNEHSGLGLENNNVLSGPNQKILQLWPIGPPPSPGNPLLKVVHFSLSLLFYLSSGLILSHPEHGKHSHPASSSSSMPEKTC